MLLRHAADGTVTLFCHRTTASERFMTFYRHCRARGFFYRVEPVFVAFAALFGGAEAGLFDRFFSRPAVVALTVVSGAYLVLLTAVIAAITLGVMPSQRWFAGHSDFVFDPGGVREHFRDRREVRRAWAWVVRAGETAAFLELRFAETPVRGVLIDRARCAAEPYARLCALLVAHGKLPATAMIATSSNEPRSAPAVSPTTAAAVVRPAAKRPASQADLPN